MIGSRWRLFRVEQLLQRAQLNFSACYEKNLSCSSRSQTTWYEQSLNQDESEIEEFGALAEKKGVSVFKMPPELRLPKEKDEDEPLNPRFFSEKPPSWYFFRCQKLAKKKKWQECLTFFEDKMLKEDKVFPEEFNYSIVIGALGREGQSAKAFKLYRGMRQRGIRPSGATYTGLFNSVAQSSNRDDLKRAIALYSKLHRSNIRMSRITYNSLIKAFGMHGSTEQMMGIFRESIIAGFEPDADTFNNILMCMKQDKDAGFRKAIEVWRQMTILGIRPNGKSVTYLLKVLKECGIGDKDVAYRKLIKEIPDPTEYKDYFKKHCRNVYWLRGQRSSPKTDSLEQIPSESEILTLEDGHENRNIAEENNHECYKAASGDDASETVNYASPSNSEAPLHQTVTVVDSPLINKKLHLNLLELPFAKEKNYDIGILDLRKDLQVSERLELIGGYKHVLKILDEFQIRPTEIVLSALVCVLPPSRRAENDVLEYSLKQHVKLDTDFFNAILRKRVARHDFSGLHEILEKMVSCGLSPNYRTWCIMALSCQKGVQGASLINEIKSKEVIVDEIFFKSLISAALRKKVEPIEGYKDVKGYDYRYLTRILREMKELGIKGDEPMVTMLETASDWPEGYERWKLADINFEQKLFKFRRLYNRWLDETEVKQQSS